MQEEGYLNSGYVALCEVGGVMGVYAGMSMVTLIQVAVYAGLVCAEWRKRRKVRPMV